MLLCYHPIFLRPYHFLKLVSFLGADRIKRASVCQRVTVEMSYINPRIQYNSNQVELPVSNSHNDIKTIMSVETLQNTDFNFDSHPQSCVCMHSCIHIFCIVDKFHLIVYLCIRTLVYVCTYLLFMICLPSEINILILWHQSVLLGLLLLAAVVLGGMTMLMMMVLWVRLPGPYRSHAIVPANMPGE